MEILMWTNKYGSCFYAARTPEELEASAREIVKQLVDEGWIFAVTDRDNTPEEAEAVALSKEEVAALPEILRTRVERVRESVRRRQEEHAQGATHRLADLQLAVEELQDLLGDHLQEWIRQARLVDLLRKGQFNDLLHEASTWHARTHPMDEGPVWSRQVEDWVDDQPPISDVPRMRRQATTRTATTRRKGQAREV